MLARLRELNWETSGKKRTCLEEDVAFIFLRIWRKIIIIGNFWNLFRKHSNEFQNSLSQIFAKKCKKDQVDETNEMKRHELQLIKRSNLSLLFL